MDKWLEQFARANFRRSGDTAHDLKTPLNVAVLNLELLRMRAAKLADAAGDEKIATYTAAIDTELRRLARIFDAFFILSTPPKDEDAPAAVDLAAIARDVAASARYAIDGATQAIVLAHESRMRQALKLFLDGASRLFPSEARSVSAAIADGERFELTVSGRPAGDDFEVSKIFKLYYTDVSGTPDIALASARLIAETYGGDLSAIQEHDKVVLRLSFPLGDR